MNCAEEEADPEADDAEEALLEAEALALADEAEEEEAPEEADEDEEEPPAGIRFLPSVEEMITPNSEK